MTNVKKQLNVVLTKHIIYPNLNDQQQFRLNKINEIKDYFVAEIKDRKLMSKRASKYIGSFDYFDKSLIVLSVSTGNISIASFATIIIAPVGIVSASSIYIVLYCYIYIQFLQELGKTIENNKK